MKRSLAALGLLLVLSLAGLGVATGFLLHNQNALAVQETTLYGDKAAARGLRADIVHTMGNRFWWSSSIPFDGEPSTHLTLSREPIYPMEPPEAELEVFLSLNYASSYYGDKGWSPEREGDNRLSPLYEAVADRTPSGTDRYEVLDLGDFLDTLPLSGRLSLSIDGKRQTFSCHDPSFWREGDGEDAEARRFLLDLLDRFSYPVPEDTAVLIGVRKSQEGWITEVSCHMVSPSLLHDGQDHVYTAYPQDIAGSQIDPLQVSSQNVPLGDSLWFTVSAQCSGKPLPGGPVPGAPGALCRLRLTGQAPKREDVQIVAPLSGHLLRMTTLGKDLLLVTVENDQIVLHVHDGLSGEETQVLPLCPDGDFWVGVNQGEDFLTVSCGKDLFLLQKQENGYAVVFHTDTTDDLPWSQWHVSSRSTQVYGGDWLARLYAFHGLNRDEEGRVSPRGCLLTVYDREGLVYAGIYRTSLTDSISWAGSQDVQNDLTTLSAVE